MTRGPKNDRRRRRRPPPGSSPSQLFVDPCAPKPVIHALAYGPDAFKDLPNTNVASATALVGTTPVVWIDLEGVGDADILRELGNRFGMHRLAVEDVAIAHQRSKLDLYPNGLFLIIRAPTEVDECFETEQISFFVGKNFL